MAETKRWEEELRISRSTNTRLLAEITGLRWLLGQHKTDEASLKKLKLQNRLLHEQVLQLKEQLTHYTTNSKALGDGDLLNSEEDTAVPRLEVGRLRLEKSATGSTAMCSPHSLLQSTDSTDNLQKLESDLSTARECMERYERNTQTLSSEVERYRAQANEAQQQLLSSRLEVARMKQQLWDGNSRTESAAREISALTEQLRAVQLQSKQEQAQYERHLASLREQLDTARKRADLEHQRAMELDADLVVLRNRLACSTARIVALSEEQHKGVALQKLHVQQLNDEVDELTEALEQCEERYAAAEEEVEHLRASLKVSQHAASSAVAQYEKLRDNLEKVAVRNSRQMEETLATHRALREAQEAAEQANEKCAKLCEERDSLAAQLEQLKALRRRSLAPSSAPSAADPSNAPSAADPSSAPSAADPSSAPSAADPSSAPSAADPSNAPSAADPTTMSTPACAQSSLPSVPEHEASTCSSTATSTPAERATPDGKVPALQPVCNVLSFGLSGVLSEEMSEDWDASGTVSPEASFKSECGPGSVSLESSRIVACQPRRVATDPRV